MPENQSVDASIQLVGFSVGFWSITQAGRVPLWCSLASHPQCPDIQMEPVPACASHPTCSSQKEWGFPCWEGEWTQRSQI